MIYAGDGWRGPLCLDLRLAVEAGYDVVLSLYYLSLCLDAGNIEIIPPVEIMLSSPCKAP